MIKQKRQLVFGCFTPQVMVATFVIETLLVVYTIVRYKLEAKGRTILAILGCLAAFQLAEYYVCTQSGVAVIAARFGYVAITLLPVLGLYLTGLLTKPLKRRTAIAMFTCAGVIATYYLISPNAFDGYECTGNYVIFQTNLFQAYAYGVYYFGFIGVTIFKAFRHMQNYANAKNYRALYWLLVAYAVFIVPVAILIVFHPDTRRAVPSIMCGFAIAFALIMTARVAPMALKKRNK